jgi:hypothetical protein
MVRESDVERPAAGVPNDRTLPSVTPGSNVLIRGPSLSGKRALAVELLSALPAGERPVALSTTSDATGFRERLAAIGHTDVADRCYVIDAMRSQVNGGSFACTDGGGHPLTSYVTSPGDLTGVGMSMSRALQEAIADGDRPRLLVDNLSTLLQYNSLERLYRFLHVLNGRSTTVGGVTVQVIHDDAHPERDVATLGHLFENVMDVVPGDGRTDVRVRDGTTAGGGTFAIEDVLSTPVDP